jgi:hypothetical protein
MLILDPHRPRSAEFVTMCGWCKRVAVPPRGWLQVEAAVVALALFDEPRPPQLTHGVCDECSQRLHEALDSASFNPVLGSL